MDLTRWIIRFPVGSRIALAILIVGAILGYALAQDHSHPPQDAELHDKFYSTWYKPNGGNPRVMSCCNRHDCYPSQIELRNGRYYARRREDLKWIRIPDGVLEHNQSDPRESPDAQSHICAPPPYPGVVSDTVYCAVLGSGI